MTGLADIDGFKIFIQVCVWLGFPPLITLGYILLPLHNQLVSCQQRIKKNSTVYMGHSAAIFLDLLLQGKWQTYQAT